MAATSDRAGDVGRPDARRQSGHPPEQSAPPIIGYLRVSPVMPEPEIERLRRELADFARQAGFLLNRVLVDRSLLHTEAFVELLRALDAGEAGHVVVPALHHLANFPGVQAAMRELVERQTGAQVLVVHPPLEGLS